LTHVSPDIHDSSPVFHVKHPQRYPQRVPARRRRGPLLALLAAVALLATACAGIGSPNGWPALSVTSDGYLVTQVDEGRVAALDPADGRQLWLFPDQLPGGAINPDDDSIELGATYATPVIDGSAVYLVSYDGLAVRV